MTNSPWLVIDNPHQTALNITQAIQHALSQVSDTCDRYDLLEGFASYFPGLPIQVESERKEEQADDTSESNGASTPNLVDLQTKERDLSNHIEQLRTDWRNSEQEIQTLASHLSGMKDENSLVYLARLNQYVNEHSARTAELDRQHRALRAHGKQVWKETEAEYRRDIQRLELQVKDREKQLTHVQRDYEQEKQRVQDTIRARHEQEIEHESKQEHMVIDQQYSPIVQEAEQNILDVQTDLEQKTDMVEQEKNAQKEQEERLKRDHEAKLAEIQQEAEEQAREQILIDRQRVEQELKDKSDEAKRKDQDIIHLDGERKRTHQEIEEGKIRYANSQVWRLWRNNRVRFTGGGTAENRTIIRERIRDMEQYWSDCQKQSDSEQAIKLAIAKGGSLSESITSAFIDSETLVSVDRWVGQACILHFMDKNLKRDRSFPTFCDEWKHLPFFRKRDQEGYSRLVRLGELATKYPQVWCWTIPIAQYYKHAVAIKRLLDAIRSSDTVGEFRERLILLDQDRYSDPDFTQMRSLWGGDRDWTDAGADEWMTEEQKCRKRQKRERNHIELRDALEWVES
jgi:hypothetical protein